MLIHLLADVCHQGLTIGADDLSKVRIAKNAAYSGIENIAKLVIGAVDVAHRLVEFERIDDPVFQEGIDLDTGIVGGEHFLRRRLDIEDALVEQNDILDEGNFEVQARFGDKAAPRNRIAETQYKRLFGLTDGEDRRHNDDDGGNRQKRHENTGRAPSFRRSIGGCARRQKR